MSCGYKKMKLNDGSSFSSANLTILGLNDDCLYKILSYLPLITLCDVGSTCRRLNQIAQRFYSRYATLDGVLFLYCSFEIAEMMIQVIGSHVKSADLNFIYVDRCGEKKDVLALTQPILEYCSNLSEIKIALGLSNYFTNYQIRKMLKSPRFQNLESVVLNCDLIDAPEILATMKNLKKLDFESNNENINKTEFLKFRNLDSLCLCLTVQLDYDMYSGIFDNNLQLKKLRLFEHLERERGEQILNLICDKLFYLEDLCLIYNPVIISKTTIMRFAKLKNLTHFRPFVPKFLLEKLVDADKLESLTYYFSNPGELITKFTKLKHLDCFGVDDTILNSLKSKSVLEDLDISENKSITNNSITAKGLLDFIEGATNLKMLNMSGCDGAFNEFTLQSIDLLLAKYNRRKLIVSCDFPVIQEYQHLSIAVANNRETNFAERLLCNWFLQNFLDI